MSAYRLTLQALNDLSDIWVFIARDNLEAADRVEQAVYQALPRRLWREACAEI